MIRHLLIPVAAFILSACSMQAMAEKRVPADVRAAVNAQIDQLLSGDTDFIFAAFPDDADNPEFQAQIARMAANVPDAEPVSRTIVGVMGTTEQAYSDRQGAIRQGTYNLAHEIAFSDGTYLLIQTAHTLDDRGECCRLRSINATRSETSPMYEDQQDRARFFRLLAILLVISTLITIVALIVRVGGRKARAKQMGGH
jgi:hypothetical protein